MKYNILLIAPFSGNGGITSWANNYLNSIKTRDLRFITVDSSLKSREFTDNSVFIRIYAGLKDLFSLKKVVKQRINENQISIMHTTTSGSFGTLRDYVLCKLCKKKNIRTILHCHYGNIPQRIKKKSLFRYFLLRTLKQYDQIWVLDQKSHSIMNRIKELEGKVLITPNFIDVPEQFKNTPKPYSNIAFIGNLVPSKGIFELIKAVESSEGLKLYIIGPGHPKIVDQIKKFEKNNRDKIYYLGQKSNKEAVMFMKSVDILALPTYFPSEAFPISILEAMSQGLMVISTDRAAIPDIMEALDGSRCGIIVKEKSHESIINAIEYIKTHKEEADQMCLKAFEKVYFSYRTDVVHALYYKNYLALINNDYQN